VGLATAHGHHILIHSNARLPAEAQQLFTTLHDGQDTVRIVMERSCPGTAVGCIYYKSNVIADAQSLRD
jgi:hypothetical protein